MKAFKRTTVTSYQLLTLVIVAFLASQAVGTAAQINPGKTVDVAALKSEVKDLMAMEVAVHFGAIKSFEQPPDVVNGSITTGEYTWGSFMRVVAAQSDVSGSSVIAGRETARPIAEMGLYEARKGGKGFFAVICGSGSQAFWCRSKQKCGLAEHERCRTQGMGCAA